MRVVQKNYCNQRTLVNYTKGCEGDMCHTAPLDISDQEPEGGEIEVCSNTAQQFSGPTHTGDSSAQTSEYSVSAVGTVPKGSQGVAVIMSGTQTLEVAPEQEELALESELTSFEQPQTEQDQEDLHIDVVGIDDIEDGTPEAGTNEVKL